MDLIKKEEKLHKETDEILEELDLINFLSKFGKIEIVGSYKLGLMVWEDIDIHIITEKPNKKQALYILKDLLERSKVLSVTIIDNRTKRVYPNYPEGFYIGIKYKNNETKWKIDIWLTSEKETEIDNLIQEKLDENNRKYILEIKSKLFDNPKYRKDILSIDIYKAVLEKGVKNLEEFQNYLKDIGKEL